MGATRREWLFRLEGRDGFATHVRRIMQEPPDELVMPMRDGSAVILYERDRFAPAMPGYAEYREVNGQRRLSFGT